MDNLVDDSIVPRPKKPSLSSTLQTWSPVAAGVLRAVAGVLAFSMALLTLPVHMATPFLSGVGLLMVVGGSLAVIKACRDEPSLRAFSRFFPVACALVVFAVGVVAFVYGPGVLGPNLRATPAPTTAPADGVIHFEPR